MKISIKHQIELIHRLTMSKFLRLYLGLAILFSSFTVAAQAPEGINYQAVARDLNGNSLSNTMITVRFGILSGSANGTLEYEEEYLMVTTNDFGLFNLVIGGGVNTNNGIRADFSEIDWGSNAHFLRVEVNNEVLSNTQLISVPYALYAKRSGNQFKAGPGIEILNNDSILNIGDLSDTNELQNLFVNAAQDSILINPGSGIAVSDLILPDDQQLNLSNDTLFLTGDNPSSVPLLPILGLDSLSAIDDTTLRAFYANGNSFDIVLRGADTSNVNELVDSLVLNNATLELYQQGGLQAAIDLDTLGNGKRDSLIDALSRLEVRLVADSARVTDSITDIRADLDLHLNNDRDTSVTNELINSILLNGTVLEIADSGGTFLTDLSSLIGTDNQNLRLNLGRDSILIDRGNGLSIAFILDSLVSLEGKFVADSTAKADSIALLRSGLDSLTVRYLNDSTSNADSLAALRAELNLINVVFQDTSEINELVNSFTLSGTDLTLIDSGGTYTVDLSVLPSINTDDQNLSLNAAQDSILIEDGSGVSIAFILDSLSAQRADIDQNQLDIDENQDSLALLRLDVNQNRTNIGINTDSLVAHRTDINQNRTDIGVNADSLVVHRIDINQNRSDISIVNDTLAVHRTDININRDTLEDIRGEFNQLRGRYLNDSTANADSLADQRAEFNQLRIRYLADSTANTDSLIAHRIDINSNRDTLVDIRGEFNQLRVRYLNDSTANADSLADQRAEFNQLRIRYLADSTANADSLADQRVEFNQLRVRYLNDSTANADSLADQRAEFNQLRIRYLADSTANTDSLIAHRIDINSNRDTLVDIRGEFNQLRVRYLNDSTANADSLADQRAEFNQLRIRYLADSTANADSLADQRAEFNQLRVRYLNDSTANADSLADQRAEFNQLRIRYLADSTANADSLADQRAEFNQLRVRYLNDSTANADSLADQRAEFNQLRIRYLADSTANTDSLIAHRIDINSNRDTLVDIRGEFNQLRGRYLNDSTANADSLADQRAEFNQLRIRYLADSTANTDSLIAHRIDINSNRDTLVDIRGEFNQLRGRYLNDSTANADSLANHRIDINLNRTNLSSLEGRYLSDSTLNADTLAAHRTDINLNRSDINDNRDSLVVHRTDINQNRTDIGIINDTLPVLRTDINFNRRELDSLQVRFAADSTNNADSLVAIRSDLNQHIALDNDTSASNEVNASVVLNGTDLEVTDAAGTIITDLSPLTAPDVVVDGSSALRLAYWKNIDTLSFFDDFYLDTANLRIGLGTTTPDSKFHLAEDIDAGFVEFRIENLNAQDGSQIVFEESGQGNNFTLRYRSTSAGAGNWFQILGDQETVVGLIVERDRGDVGIGIPIDTDPEAKLEVAGAVKVEAAGLTPVEGMIQYVGSDFQGYDGTQWRSFIDTATCPAGMTNINGRICMETNERAAASWFQAATDCVTDGYKLPNRAEWYGAASNAGLINETGNWEWVDNTDINNVGKVGNTTLQSYATDNPTNTEAFRCMLYLK